MKKITLKNIFILLFVCIVIIILLISLPYSRYVYYWKEEYIEVFELREDIERSRLGIATEVRKECNYKIIEEGCKNHLIIPPSRCKFIIRNEDVISDNFKVEIYLKYRDKTETTKIFNIFIKKGETKTIKFKVPKRLIGYRYYITPPTKIAKEYLDYSKGEPVIMCKKSGHGENIKEYCLVKKKRIFLDLRKEKYTIIKEIIKRIKSKNI